MMVGLYSVAFDVDVVHTVEKRFSRRIDKIDRVVKVFENRMEFVGLLEKNSGS